MSLFLQLLINSLIAGSIYALVAAGFSLIYSTSRVVHFAHGVTVALSGYLLYLFFNLWNIPFAVSVILALIGAGGIGIGFHYFYQAFLKKKASGTILLMASFGALIFLESLILMLFGADVKTIGFIKIAKGLEVLGAIITPLQIVILGVAVLLLIGLYFLMKKTKLGKALRAVADNKSVSQIVGINTKKMFRWSFVIGSVIGGIGGVLIALEQNLEPVMGTNLIIKGFTGAIIGGIGSVPGAILGSFLLGIVENFGIWYLPSGYKDAIAFVLLFLFLLFRPQGILGIKRSNK